MYLTAPTHLPPLQFRRGAIILPRCCCSATSCCHAPCTQPIATLSPSHVHCSTTTKKNSIQKLRCCVTWRGCHSFLQTKLPPAAAAAPAATHAILRQLMWRSLLSTWIAVFVHKHSNRPTKTLFLCRSAVAVGIYSLRLQAAAASPPRCFSLRAPEVVPALALLKQRLHLLQAWLRSNGPGLGAGERACGCRKDHSLFQGLRV